MNKLEEYYARIESITGGHLFDKTVGVYSAPFVSKAVELLISCGVLGIAFQTTENTESFFSNVWAIKAGKNFEFDFMCEMKQHNQFEDRWRFSFANEKGENEDIILAGGTVGICEEACKQAHQKNIPAIVGFLFANGTSTVSVIWPGQDLWFLGSKEKIVSVSAERYFDWIDLNNQMANIAKAILLEGTPWQRNDIMSVLRLGKDTIILAHPQWPWVSRYVDTSQKQGYEQLHSVVNNQDTILKTGMNVSGKTVMIVGLGSLGGIAAEHLRILDCNVIGIDGKAVSIHNPVRQIYSTSDIGVSKAHALGHVFVRNLDYIEEEIDVDGTLLVGSGVHQFIGLTINIPDSRVGSEIFKKLLEKFSPDLVMLATAHPAEYRMADECRKKNIPHIIGRCYNRARWFEITVVNGNNGPCFGCLQGHLYKGAPASLTEEQLARYDMAGDEVNVVQAEPATRVDTGRCADIMARFSKELLTAQFKSSWFSRMLSEERTCLIGGNYAEYHEEKEEWTYGVSTPGGVALYGVINFIGSETESEKTCLYCGKTHEVLIKRKNLI